MDAFSTIGADSDAVAALALVRALIRALERAGKLSTEDVSALLDDAANQMTQGGPGRKFVGGHDIVDAMRSKA